MFVEERKDVSIQVLGEMLDWLGLEKKGIAHAVVQTENQQGLDMCKKNKSPLPY